MTNRLFGDTLLWQFVSDGTANLDSPAGTFTSPNNLVPYLFFVAYDWSGTNTNNDYLVHVAVLNDTSGNEQSVPEPASLALLGSGLAAMVAKRRPARRR